MFRRYASSKPLFAFPTTPNPTPHQIFHLPRNASQREIKQRYLELVKIYHPDKVEQSNSNVAHARFQAITAAYASLRGSNDTFTQDTPPSPAARALYKRNRNLYTGPQFSDDRWKDRIIVSGILFAAFCFVIQTASMRRDLVLEANRPVTPTNTGRSPLNTAPIEEARLADPEH